MRKTFSGSIVFAALALTAPAWVQTGNTSPVTLDNFIRAESDSYMSNAVKEGAFGKFQHHRAPPTSTINS